jgi:endonuclease YncB( thermonuclease family)
LSGEAASTTGVATTAIVTTEPPATPTRDGESAQVVRVLDGDSIEVELSGDTTEVRLLGINAPERNECYGDAARDALVEYLDAGPITLVAAGGESVDRFGRLLRYVYAGESPVAEEMLMSGHAIVVQGDHPRDDAFVALADGAADAGLGLWQPDACGPEAASAVRIASVEYNPAGPDRDNATNEYVAIRNEGDAAIDLTDWIVRDESSQHRYRFPSVALAPGATMRLRSGCGDDAQNDVYWCAGDPVWSNGGDTALLQDPHGNVVDRVLYRGDY